MKTTVAIAVQPKTNQEWQGLLQAASWRQHFSDSIEIQIFLSEGKVAELPKRVIYGFESLKCSLREVKGLKAPIASLDLIDQTYETQSVIVTRPTLLVNRYFDLNKSFLVGSPLTCILDEDHCVDTNQYNRLIGRIFSEAPKGESSTSVEEPKSIDPGLLVFENNSQWHKYFNFCKEILYSHQLESSENLLRTLPLLAIRMDRREPQWLAASDYCAHPLREGSEKANVFAYSDSSDLYKSGLNKAASLALSKTKSGFKNLMELLQEKNHDIPEEKVKNSLHILKPSEPRPKAKDETIHFAIIGAMRTGSNLLQDYINQCSSAHCFGELFNPAFINEPQHKEYLGFTLGQRNNQAENFVDRLIASSPPRSTLGFRYFDQHLSAGLNAWLDKSNDRRLVFLYRDPFESYVSLQSALETKQWILKRSSDRKTSQWNFSGENFLKYCERQAQFYSRIYKEVRSCGLPVFHISYRELHDHDILSGLVKFIGSHAPEDGFKQNIIKQIDQHPSNFITNFECVEEFIKIARLKYPSLDWNVLE